MSSCFIARGFDCLNCNTLVSILSPTLNPQLSISPASRFVKPYLNKVNMMRSSPDLPYMTLDGPDLEPPRDHVFHLTFPADWRQPEIFQLFRNFGQIFIGWLLSLIELFLRGPLFRQGPM